MSSSPSNQSVSASDIEGLRRELTEKADLVQSIRQELIRSQITVLELQDSILQKETDKADAVAILGQAELVLESKINYIFELDRALNEQIALIQRELSDARSAHQSITADLVQKLDQANRALGDTHNLAAQYAREAAEEREKLARALASVQQLETTNREAASQLSALRVEKTEVDQALATSASAKAALERELAAIHQSLFWKITAPFRSSGGRKS